MDASRGQAMTRLLDCLAALGLLAVLGVVW
jgi:hypothetical protein